MFSILVVSLLLSLSSAAKLYGTVAVSQIVYPVSIDTTTGTQTNLGAGSKLEGQAQGLSCATADTLFVLGYNFNTSKANLVGFDVSDGSIKYDIPSLPFLESGFVGVGQQIACDTSEVVLVGHEDATGSHHIIAFNPTTEKVRKVVQIPGSNIGILGGTSTLDTKRGIGYFSFAINNTKTKQIDINLYAVSVRPGPDVGKYKIVPTDESAGHAFSAMKYDAQLDQIIGFSGDPVTKAREIMSMDGAALGTARTWKAMGDVVGFQMEDGAIIAVDGKNSIMYAIMQPTPTGAQTYVNDTGCGCEKDAFCCRDPTQPQDQGACYTHKCNQIPTGAGGLNISEPFRLVAMDLTREAKVIGSPPLCTLKEGNCPWQLDML